MAITKNNLKPKPYAKNNIERWKHLTGYELQEFSTTYYTRDQIRAIAAKYGVKGYSKYKTAADLIEAIKETDGYIQAGKKVRKTLFESIRELTNGESQSPSWYRTQLKKLMSQIKKQPSRMTIEQKMDSVQNIVNRDDNEIRRTVFPGHMYFFTYDAISKLPYYDRFPMVYVVRKSDDYFYGANLHYLSMKQRAIVIRKLESGTIDVPLHIVHKYLIRECKSLFLDLATYEWETAAMLPVEEFVMKKSNSLYDYDPELVWEETKSTKSKKLKASIKRF